MVMNENRIVSIVWYLNLIVVVVNSVMNEVEIFFNTDLYQRDSFSLIIFDTALKAQCDVSNLIVVN